MSETLYENLTITNSFIFGKVMQEPSLCKHFLEKLLGIKIQKISYPEREKEIGIMPDGHDVRLDVYADDTEDSMFNVEMQAYMDRDIRKRSRYYQGVMDVNFLKKGMDYGELPRSFVIFICNYDVFGLDKPIYAFENRCVQEDGLRLGDDAYRIFLCLTPHFADADIDEDIKAFLFYIKGIVKEDNQFIQRLDEELYNVKNNKLWRKEYMKYELDLMMMRRMGYEEGKEAAQEEINAMKELQGATEKRAQDAEQKVSVLMGRLSELGYYVDPEKILENVALVPCK